MSFVSRTREFVAQHARQGLAAGLAPYGGERAAWRAEAQALARARGALAQDQERLARRLARRGSPFTADMTVHEAWARHPGVRAIFTRRHLPACPACAVGVDETLAEAAFGYRMSLEELLQELNALLRG